MNYSKRFHRSLITNQRERTSAKLFDFNNISNSWLENEEYKKALTNLYDKIIQYPWNFFRQTLGFGFLDSIKNAKFPNENEDGAA